MNPFSARYYLKQNKGRVAKIIFMISMLALVYVGGLYLTNISEEAKAVERERRDFVEIRQTFDDNDGEQMSELVDYLMSDSDMEVFDVRTNLYRYKTMLGFSNGDRAYVFSKDDFLRFNERIQIIPSSLEIPDNTVVLSEKQAKYLKVEDGGSLWDDTEKFDAYYGEGPFHVITFPGKAFSAYFVSDDSASIEYYLITWKMGSSKVEFFQRVEELRKQYDKVYFMTYEDAMDELQKNFDINNIIYYSIIAILSVVFAITTNAVFVGLYDKRKQEFTFYQGIGIQKKAIYKKVASEILCMNGIGLLIGVGLSILSVSLLNEFIYHKDGLSMWYYHPTAFLAALFCDLAILIPGIGLRIRNISKDIKDVNFL